MAERMDRIGVQVCYARPGQGLLLSLDVPAGTDLQTAIRWSGILEAAPEIDLRLCRVGIHGKLKPLDTVLRQQDRVEIYRPLIADPKDARRRRAKKAGTR